LDPLHSKMVPLGKAAPPLSILDLVFLIQMDYHSVLYKFVS